MKKGGMIFGFGLNLKYTSYFKKIKSTILIVIRKIKNQEEELLDLYDLLCK